jgi:DNA 3'-phosphatase
MMNDLDIKNKRILLFDFDGTLIETASGNTFATDLTDMRIKMDVVNKALDLMQENGVKVFAIVSNQGGVEAGFVSGADIEAKIEYVLRSVHDLAVKRGIRGVLYEKRLCYSNDEQNPMRKPNTGMIDDILMKCKDIIMPGMNFSQLKGCSLMVGDASGLPGQFSDSDKVCAENAGIDYMDVIQFLGKDLDLNYVLSKEHTSEGIVILSDGFIYILENPYGVDLNIKITLKDFYNIETNDGKTAIVDDVLNLRIKKDQYFNSYSDIIKIETLEDGSIKYTSLYHESKENSNSLS